MLYVFVSPAPHHFTSPSVYHFTSHSLIPANTTLSLFQGLVSFDCVLAWRPALPWNLELQKAQKCSWTTEATLRQNSNYPKKDTSGGPHFFFAIIGVSLPSWEKYPFEFCAAHRFTSMPFCHQLFVQCSAERQQTLNSTVQRTPKI